MKIPGFNGIYDRFSNRAYSATTDKWDDFTSWDDWTVWNKTPVSMTYMPVTSGPSFVNLGSVKTVNVLTNIQANGKIHYYFFVNQTSEIIFDNVGNGESYTTTHVEPNQQSIPSLSGQFVSIVVGIEYDPTKGVPYFDSISFDFTSTGNKTVSYANINSATLPGTVSDRVFNPNDEFGAISEVQVTSQGTTTPYNVDLYVSKNQTSSYTFPDIISKSNDGVHLKFIGIDGEPRDSVFDITVSALPGWYNDTDGNLKER